MRAISRVAFALVLVAAAFMSGCATIVKGSTQDLNINTDPTGAACDLSRGGSVIATVNPTPGSVQIKKDKNDIEVKCKKAGYVETAGHIPANFEGWSVGNILIGGFIGIAVDYSSGALNSYEPELFVKLTPEKFASPEDRTDFYEKWRSDVLQNSTKAKIAAAKTCVKDQCDEITKRIDKETELALAAIESNRNLQSSPTSAAASQPPSQPQVQARASPRTEQIGPPPTKSGLPRTGDRWKYKLMDGNRSIGTVAIDIVDVRGNTVKERITREDERSFLAERVVDAEFNPIRFQDTVTSPGGYQLAEISPYSSSEQGPKAGQRWADIPATLQLVQVGKKTLLMQARVVKQEKVRVPAGEFDATLVEATGKDYFVQTSVKITCRFWYATQMMRSVKMSLQVEQSVNTNNSNVETYELTAFEPAN